MIESMGNEFLPSCSSEKIDYDLVNETVETRKSVYYRLGESEIFEYANKNTMINGEKLINVIPRMILTDAGFYHISLSDLEATTKYELFDSARFKIKCRKTIEKLIDSGKIIMVYSDSYKLPTCIPYIVKTNGSKDCSIYVNVSDFFNIDDYGKYFVSVTRNYNAIISALFAASLAYAIITMFNSIPFEVADGLIVSYASMFEKCVNSIVHLDPVARDKVKYLAAEFAMVQMYGTENGIKAFNKVKEKYFPKLSKLIMDSIDNQFKIDSFDKISMFIDELKRIYPNMKALSTYTLYDKWIRNYGSATAMSVDYIGYHIYTVIMAFMESPLITRMAIEPIIEKSHGVDMYQRIQAMVNTIN